MIVKDANKKPTNISGDILYYERLSTENENIVVAITYEIATKINEKTCKNNQYVLYILSSTRPNIMFTFNTYAEAYEKFTDIKSGLKERNIYSISPCEHCFRDCENGCYTFTEWAKISYNKAIERIKHK